MSLGVNLLLVSNAFKIHIYMYIYICIYMYIYVCIYYIYGIYFCEPVHLTLTKVGGQI